MTRQLEPALLPSRALRIPRMSYRQLLLHPWENPPVEWVEGAVVMMAPIGDAHNVVTNSLIQLIGPHVPRPQHSETRLLLHAV